jgi:hypothetical protein
MQDQLRDPVNVHCVLAVGSKDHGVSITSTHKSRPVCDLVCSRVLE